VQPAVTGFATPSSESVKTRRNGILFYLIATLALAGMIVSAISLQRHYAKSKTEFCEIGQNFNCDIVNRSEYSTFVGIPVAGIGVAGYGILLILSTLRRTRPGTSNRLLGAAIAGLVFALYLTYIEAYVLKTWCILCLISLALISLISMFTLVAKLRTLKS
jgi:vitamin-K-epoxide reductase (warfarin-sensitive)